MGSPTPGPTDDRSAECDRRARGAVRPSGIGEPGRKRSCRSRPVVAFAGFRLVVPAPVPRSTPGRVHFSSVGPRPTWEVDDAKGRGQSLQGMTTLRMDPAAAFATSRRAQHHVGRGRASFLSVALYLAQSTKNARRPPK